MNPSLFDLTATTAPTPTPASSQPRGKVVTLPLQVVKDPIRDLEHAIAAGLPALEKERAGLVTAGEPLKVVSDGDGMRRTEAHARKLQAFNKRVQGLYKPIKQHFHELHSLWCERENAMLTTTLYTDLRNGIKRYLSEQARLKSVREQEQLRANRTAAAAPVMAATAVPVPSMLFAPVMAAAPDTQLATSAVTDGWNYEVTDFQQLALAVGQGRVPVEVLMVNEPYLRDMVTRYRGALRYPGLRVFPDVNVTIR